MIVKITVKDEEKTWAMLFGDSYKRWSMQFEEWLYTRKFHKQQISILETAVSKSKWIQNGLKWCASENFQEELDKENERRNYSDFEFNFDRQVDRKSRELWNKVFG